MVQLSAAVLPRVLASLVLLASVPGAPADATAPAWDLPELREEDKGSFYGPVGEPSGDATEAWIDLERWVLRVGSYRFPLSNCSSRNEGRPCHASDYMTFAEPPEPWDGRWDVMDRSFRPDPDPEGPCVDGEVAYRARHEFGDVRFCYRRGQGLVAWRYEYNAQSGGHVEHFRLASTLPDGLAAQVNGGQGCLDRDMRLRGYLHGGSSRIWITHEPNIGPPGVTIDIPRERQSQEPFPDILRHLLDMRQWYRFRFQATFEGALQCPQAPGEPATLRVERMYDIVRTPIER